MMATSTQHFYFNNSEAFQKEDDLEYLEEIPYSSSSSADRSSIGSIPWADDAIKQNQIDWERVERMLNTEEDLPINEPELKKEIEEWRKRIPQVPLIHNGNRRGQQNILNHFTKVTYKNTNSHFDTLSNLSLNSLDDDNDHNVEDDTFKHIQTNSQNRRRRSSSPLCTTPTNNNPTGVVDNLSQLLKRDLHITSVALGLRHRPTRETIRGESSKKDGYQLDSHISSAASAWAEPTSVAATKSANKRSGTKSNMPLHSVLLAPRQRDIIEPSSYSDFCMPPIMNILESKRRFRKPAKNQSFVQLTEVQEVKSAAAVPPRLQHPEQRRNRQVNGAKTNWHPLAVPNAVSNRFKNNANSLALPIISSQHIQRNRLVNSGSNARNLNNPLERQNFGLQRNPDSTPSPNSITTPSTGRSISAAIHNPRGASRSNYFPYSASQFWMFN